MSDKGLIPSSGGPRGGYGSIMAREGSNPVPGPSTATFFDEPHFKRLCDTITTNIYTVAKSGSTLEKTLKIIGSKNDSDSVRDSVHVVTSSAAETISDTANQLKQLGALLQRSQPASQRNQEKMRVVRLTSDFKQAVQKFTEAQKEIVAKMKTNSLATASLASFADDDEQQKRSLIDAENEQQRQLQLQHQIEFDQGLLIERENRVRQIEQDIVDVNDIMKDLAILVNEQGDVVDRIEDNIEHVHTDVEGARSELQKAASYQNKYRKRLFCLLTTGGIILIIVVIILITSLKN